MFNPEFINIKNLQTTWRSYVSRSLWHLPAWPCMQGQAFRDFGSIYCQQSRNGVYWRKVLAHLEISVI